MKATTMKHDVRPARRFPFAAAALLAATLFAALAPAAGAAAAPALPAGTEVRFELRPVPDQPGPPPSEGALPIQLVLDDGTSEGTVGVADASGAKEFLWFNRFAWPGEPFDLEEVHVLFPPGGNMMVGDAVQLAVYRDPDGDPTNGADLLATFDETIQAIDGLNLSVYPLAPAVTFTEPGDVLIGVVPRFLQPGDPPTSPAAVDNTASQQRSWIAIWSADPPDPPELPPDLLIDLIDDVAPTAAGNWMIRGFGGPAPVAVIPALDGSGLALLALVLAAAGFVVLRRLRGRHDAAALGLALLAAAAALAPAGPASAQVVIDEFTTVQGPVTDPPGGGSTAVTGGADILGGKRGLLARNLAGSGPTSVQVASGALDFSVAATTPDSRGEADVIWDGDADNDSSTFDPSGFTTPVDLTDGGTQGGIRLTIEQAQAGTHLVLTVYEDDDEVSRAGRVLPAIASTTDVFINFSELVTAPGAAGPADLTQVGAITLRLGAAESPSAPTLSISHIETAPPAVAAIKIDTVGGVDPAGPVAPGSTIRYRVTITNPGAGAAEGVDFDDLVNDPNLGVPGAARTTPLARRDQYVTVTDTPIDSENDPAPALTANDADPDGNPVLVVATTGQPTAQGGSVDVAADGHFVYTPPPLFVGVDSFTYTLQATAGDPTTNAAGMPIGPIGSSAYVIIDRVPPEITAGGTLNYTENDPPTAIDPALTVVDVDSTNLFGATVQITGNHAMGEDVLGFVDVPPITGTWMPATGTLTLTGSDTVADYQAALRSVTYENTSEDPSTLQRTVTWTATDGGETSAPATSTINVASVNDLPIVTTTAGATNFTEDGGPVPVDSMLTVTDADDADLASATVTITNLLDAGLETLAANTMGTSITALYAAPTLTLTGPDTVANFQQVLRSVTYENASQDPNLTDRIVRFIAHDGTDPSAPADKTVTITPQNDPPVAGDDLWHTIGNTQLNVDPDVGDPAILTPHVLATTPGAPDGVRDNDADPVENDNHVVTGIVGCADGMEPFDCPTANGGTVSLEADGSFTYAPAAGDTMASDSFQYILTDDGFPGPASDIGTVTIQRFERVWYVDNDFGAGGNGTSASPFNTLSPINGAGGAGDSDSPNDYIFVHFGDGNATGQTAGLVLENGQHLLGEHAGLSIPVNLNGNGSPTVLHAGTPGSRPLISHTGAGNSALSASNAIPAQIRGLRLSSAAESAIDLTTLAAFAGAGTLAISDNVINAGLEGLDLNHGGTGAIMLALHDNSVTAAGTGIDVQRTGTGALTVTAFDDNVVTAATGGTGILVNGGSGPVVFDATPGLPLDPVAGGTTVIGQTGDGVGGGGLVLTSVAGDLAFTDLDVFADGGVGLRVASSGALNAGAGTGFRITVPAGVATIDANLGPAVNISGSSVTLPLGFLESTNSPTTGLSLVNAFGGTGQIALSVSSGQITDPGGASGTAVNVSGGNGNVALGIPITNNSGNAVTVSSRSTDTVSFTGAITETGSGVSATGNGGTALISFRGGVSATTGSSAAFTATGGGNVEVCDENPCSPSTVGGLVNALATTTGTALNVVNTTITANGLEFRSIAANGAPNGIVLNNTGAANGLRVAGTGSAGSGGTIQNITNRGAAFIDARNIRLNHMNFTNANTTDGATSDGTPGGNENTDENGALHFDSVTDVDLESLVINGAAQHGINGNDVTDLDISNTTISNTGNEIWESGIYLFQLKGLPSASRTSVFNNVQISNTGQFNLIVLNSVGTNAPPAEKDRLELTGCTFSASGVNVPGDHVTVANSGTANFQTVVSGSSFSATPGRTSDSIQIDAGNTSSSDASITTSTFVNGNVAVNLSGSGTSTTTFNVANNSSVSSRAGNTVNIAANGSSSLRGTISGNSISTNVANNAGSGIDMVVDATGSIVADINGNTINGQSTGIRGGARNAATGTADLTIRNNTVTSGGTSEFAGVWLFAGNGSPGETNRTCVNFVNNTIDITTGIGFVDYYLEQFTGNTFQIQGLVGSGTNAANVASFVAGTDADPSPTDPTVDVASGTVVNYTNAVCATP